MPALRELTAQEVAVVAGMLAKLRPYGAPQWQPAGIRATLAKVAHLDAADVLVAAIRLSQDRTAETPAQIAIPSSECWREKVSDRVHVHKPYVREHTCGVCGFSESECRLRWEGDHEFEQMGSIEPLEKDEAVEVVTELKNHLQPMRDHVAEATEIRKQVEG